jgi:26S proteasome regulatory subunit N6
MRIETNLADLLFK